MGISRFVNDRYTLPELTFAYDDLEPWCSAETLHLHHLKHHAAYVASANETSEELATVAERRLQSNFPGWKVTSEASCGSPAWELITRADLWEPDLM